MSLRLFYFFNLCSFFTGAPWSSDWWYFTSVSNYFRRGFKNIAVLGIKTVTTKQKQNNKPEQQQQKNSTCHETYRRTCTASLFQLSVQVQMVELVYFSKILHVHMYRQTTPFAPFLWLKLLETPMLSISIPPPFVISPFPFTYLYSISFCVLWHRQLPHYPGRIWKRSCIISTVRPTVHTNPSRKQSFSKTLFKHTKFQWKRRLFVFVWTVNILKTELLKTMTSW